MNEFLLMMFALFVVLIVNWCQADTKDDDR